MGEGYAAKGMEVPLPLPLPLPPLVLVLLPPAFVGKRLSSSVWGTISQHRRFRVQTMRKNLPNTRHTFPGRRLRLRRGDRQSSRVEPFPFQKTRRPRRKSHNGEWNRKQTSKVPKWGEDVAKGGHKYLAQLPAQVRSAASSARYEALHPGHEGFGPVDISACARCDATTLDATATNDIAMRPGTPFMPKRTRNSVV